jgi:hypothetical protein
MGAGNLLRRILLVGAGIVVVTILGAPSARAGQSNPPPIEGVTGTIATEETVRDVHKAGRGVFGKVARLFGRNGRDADATPEDAAGAEAFAALTTGTPVVVQNATVGERITAEDIDRRRAEGVEQMDAVVTSVQRKDRTITIKLADGTRQMLRFAGRADRAVAVVDQSGGPGVVVVTKDARGERVVMLFNRVS